MAGESAGYYNGGDEEALRQGDRGQYQPPQGQPYQQQQQYGQYQQNQQQQQGFSQAPPQYNQPGYGPNPNAFANNDKPTFDQAFKIEKPKLNDWWAGLLLMAVFAGFVAISGISLQGYGM